MARPKKEGIEYFPLDVNFYRNRKIRRLIRSQGEQSIGIWVVILSLIYEGKGYYVTFDENTCFDIADICGVKEGAIEEFVKAAIKVGLFNSFLFEKFKILTSDSIQEQYIDIIKRSKRTNEIEKKYDVSSINIDVSSEETTPKEEETPKNKEESTQRKEKKNKVNKNKENTTNQEEYLIQIYSYLESNGFGSPYGNTMGENVKFWFQDLEEAGLTIEQADKWLMRCVDIAIANNKRRWNYLDGILKNRFNLRLFTPEAIEGYEKTREATFAKRNKFQKPIVRKETLPRWAATDYDWQKEVEEYQKNNPDIHKRIEEARKEYEADRLQQAGNDVDVPF